MILHLDMDAFFASVEQMDYPELKGMPVIIGQGSRGVVATASYEARIYGIHSAMPVAMARKLCPHGLFLHGRYQRYSEISQAIMKSLRTFSPLVQKASIDEAYLDISHLLGQVSTPKEIGLSIKKTVADVSGGLSCSVGIAPVKFLAKICSDMQKPDGLSILLAADVPNFLPTLPIEKLPGVGKKMAQSLHAFGISTVGQIANLSRDFLEQKYGKFGLMLHDRANGIDPRPVHENLPQKSEGCERTFSEDIRDKNILADKLRYEAEKIAMTLRKNNISGRTITLKMKFADFRQITRAQTLPCRTDDPLIIYDIARAILDATPLPMPLRLIGITVSGFEPKPEQLPLPGIDFVKSSVRSRKQEG